MDQNPQEVELNLDELDQIEADAEKNLQVKNRYQQLANDKRELAQQKEAAEKAKAEAEAKAQAAEKERDFFKNFSQVSGKYPNAGEFQEQILERVNKGYDMEDAVVAVLNKEGKLDAYAPQAPQPPRPEGGSSLNTPGGEKTLGEMNQNEMLDTLKDLEKDGSLQQELKRGINVS